MFPPAQLLDPLRIVQGDRNSRYDCPDLAALDRHIVRLRRRMTSTDDCADRCRVDIDRLLDRRLWLTLPVADRRVDPRQG